MDGQMNGWKLQPVSYILPFEVAALRLITEKYKLAITGSGYVCSESSRKVEVAHADAHADADAHAHAHAL